MKKIFFVFVIFGLLSFFPKTTEAVNLRNEIRKEVRDTLKETGTKQAEIKKNLFEKTTETVKKLSFAARITGEIKSINDKVLTIAVEDKNYEITVTDKTQLRRRFWGKAELSEFSVGNKVNVIGKWTDEAKTKIEARLVRNLSIQKRWGVFFGDVTSKTDNSFIIKSVARGEETVYPTSATKYVDRTEKTITLKDIKVNDKVRIKGVWDRTLKKITEVDQVKDFSIPVKPTSTPTPASST